jgi:hypothetical protein
VIPGGIALFKSRQRISEILPRPTAISAKH